MTVLPAMWSAATAAAAPALRIALRRRAGRGKETAARLGERRGLDRVERPEGELVWVHAASVGESLSVLPVLGELTSLARNLTILLTTGTVTSAQLVGERLALLGLGGRVLHRFVPLDVPRWTGRFLDHWRPDAAVFVESELWPNLLAGCRSRGMPTMLLNARLSPRSFARWRRAPGFARVVLGNLDVIWAQSDLDAERLSSLGARQVAAPGNLKFSAPPLEADATELARLRSALDGRPVWVAASTHPGEEEIVLAAHRRLRRPGLLTIVAPRHPERGAAIAAMTGEEPTRRRSLGEGPPDRPGFWIADTLGELGLWYRLAQAALVGRSLVSPGGGQNPLEPARIGCPLACGPFVQNFPDAVAVLERAGVLARVHDAASLAQWVAQMLDDPAQRERAAEAGRRATRGEAELPAAAARAILGLLASRQKG